NARFFGFSTRRRSYAQTPRFALPLRAAPRLDGNPRRLRLPAVRDVVRGAAVAMMMSLVATIVWSATAAGAPGTGGGNGSARLPEVETFGTIAQLVRDHDASAKVALGTITRLPHAYALGSLEDLRG